MQYHFDQARANRAINFIQSLKLIEGEWAGQPFILQDWQKQIVSDLFGWVDEKGYRKYKMAYISVPRKAAKSTFGAAVALYVLYADNEQGAQIYIAAADREQASIIFRMSSEMVARSKTLTNKSKIIPSVKRITYPLMGSFIHAISSEAYSKHGFNAHLVLYDELHAAPNRDLWDVLNTSQGARRQPLFLQFTTAGYDRKSICFEQYDYAKKVQSGVVDDPNYYVCIYEADQEDDWTDPEVWKKAQPSMGVTVQMDYYERECRRAKETPSYQNTFKRLLLNQWTDQAEVWIDNSKWELCADDVSDDDLIGRECYAGMDLSTTTDLTSVALVFPLDDGRFAVRSTFWLPKDTVREKIDRDRVPYDAWIRDGFIQTTPGDIIDYAFIRKYINDMAEIYNLQEIAYDPWNATQITVELADDGFEMIQFRQGFITMSPASKEFERNILERKLLHGGNPVLKWNMSNTTVKEDPSGNIKPDKMASNGRIDGIIALIMGLDRAIRNSNNGSPYESRGILTI